MGYDAGRQYAPHQIAASHAGGGAWSGHDPYAHAAEPSLDQVQYGQREAHEGTLEQTYAEDDVAYEKAEPRRGRKLAMVLAGAVVIGGGLAYAYSTLLGPASNGVPPVVKSADGPFKVKPSDPGGKQFAHTDSKIMGRLGDGRSDRRAQGARARRGTRRLYPAAGDARRAHGHDQCYRRRSGLDGHRWAWR
jgi:hypothetical protein